MVHAPCATRFGILIGGLHQSSGPYISASWTIFAGGLKPNDRLTGAVAEDFVENVLFCRAPSSLAGASSLFPQLFDSLLLTWVWIARRDCFQAIEALEAEMLLLPGVKLGIHRFGGMEFASVANGRELGHLHGHGLLDVHLEPPQALALIAAGRVRPHHVFPNSGWISFQLESSADVPFAVELLGSRLPLRA